jgi:hypothetical protein
LVLGMNHQENRWWRRYLIFTSKLVRGVGFEPTNPYGTGS